ncbi:MAG: hypothetical protein DI498_09220 [Paracoccus denitrificans]|nr:MAG: hypothetical protein DI498_09220 [Paracoccus denitrificans]PZO84058.1 MAG: hypothetical protein DI633_09220 [Paracoccus denitrificans]
MNIRERLQIMVVDDMSTSRGLIVQALELMGLRHVTDAGDGAAAATKLTRQPVHLVISDYNMPGIDGLQLLQWMRAQPALRKTGFVLITGRAEQEMIDRGRRLGMNNFLRKPFTPAELKGCLEAVIGKF